MNLNVIAAAGAFLAGASVALGAYAAHGLDSALQSLGRDGNLAERLAWFDTAVRYQFMHALALLIVGMAGSESQQPALGRIAILFLLGIALFSGSLYAMTFLGDAWRKLGAVTPLGGLAMIVAWLWLTLRLATPRF